MGSKKHVVYYQNFKINARNLVSFFGKKFYKNTIKIFSIMQPLKYCQEKKEINLLLTAEFWDESLTYSIKT